MEITFLGTGGGRINLLQQIRWTGGFRINSTAANIHVDPGLGALIRSLALKQNVLKLDAVVVTHAHIDHCNDANLMIEAMSDYALKTKGILIASQQVLDDPGEKLITQYHKEHCAEIFSPKLKDVSEQHTFKTKKGSFDMEFIRVRHDEPTTFGFKLKVEGKTIGYTSDTNYFEELGRLFSNCDYLIINVLKPQDDGIPDHLETADAIKIINAAQPKKPSLKNHKPLVEKASASCLDNFYGIVSTRDIYNQFDKRGNILWEADNKGKMYRRLSRDGRFYFG